jgi:hypothetical protein
LNDLFEYKADRFPTGPEKPGDPNAPQNFEPTLPTQDGGWLATG